MTTSAPSCAYFSAIARPIPRPEPVITATLPDSKFISFLLLKGLHYLYMLPTVGVHQSIEEEVTDAASYLIHCSLGAVGTTDERYLHTFYDVLQ